MRCSLISFGLLIGLAVANPIFSTRGVKSKAFKKAPPGAIVVDGSGSTKGSFKTVQEGVNALLPNSTKAQVLYIKAGTYAEQVYIPALQSSLTVQGETSDVNSYKKNKVTITNNISRNTVPNNDLTATVRNWSPNTKFYNLNIENTFGHTATNGQNLAISAQADSQGYYGVQFIGYQDTILAQLGNQLYAKCLIVGVVDFIFGQQSHAWFEGVDIRTFDAGYITASGGLTEGASQYVINRSTVAALNSSVAANSTFLGRPWKEYAYVVFQNSELSNVVKPAGWSAWSAATPNTNISTLAEYGNTGAGAAGPRADFAKMLEKPIAIESVLGSSWKSQDYVDAAYM